MKKLTIYLFMGLFPLMTFSQSISNVPEQNIPTDIIVTYRLFSTKNAYTFIKLNTRNGKMTQVQWSTESKSRFETVLSDVKLINDDDEEINGRFFLYPTTNIYNFVLLDQFDGRTWQVQWGNKSDRMVLRIY